MIRLKTPGGVSAISGAVHLEPWSLQPSHREEPQPQQVVGKRYDFHTQIVRWKHDPTSTDPRSKTNQLNNKLKLDLQNG